MSLFENIYLSLLNAKYISADIKRYWHFRSLLKGSQGHLKTGLEKVVLKKVAVGQSEDQQRGRPKDRTFSAQNQKDTQPDKKRGHLQLGAFI